MFSVVRSFPSRFAFLLSTIKNMPPRSNQKIVVALGGNAISAPGEEGTIYEQFANSQQTARLLCDAIQAGYSLVITHGNGPQVGSVLRRSEIASSELYPIPLEVCVADTQAGMGYMIAQSLTNEFQSRGESIEVTTLVTTVEVDRQDPAFDSPAKPIGPRFNRSVASSHEQKNGWQVVEIEKDVYRRVVPSPKPKSILPLPTIRRLVEADELVICCGGGGIPVTRNEVGQLEGAAAVIDKDLTTAMLASQLGLSAMVILTGVDQVYLHFNQPNQQALDEITVAEAQRYLDEGHFAAGSMAPKIEAAITFLKDTSDPQAYVLIAELSQLTAALAGETGTRIVPC